MVTKTNNELAIGKLRLKRSIGRRRNGTAILIGSNSDGYLTCQDGNGRLQHKWNATYGTRERYLVSNEPAYFNDIPLIRNPYYQIKYAPPGIRGEQINWQTHLAVKTDGNVGIGTNNPTERLDVAGTVKCQRVVADQIVAPLPSLSGDNTASIYQTVRDAVVSLLVRQGTQYFTSTGFFVTANGWVATAGHNLVGVNLTQPVDGVWVTVSNFNNTGASRVVPATQWYVDGAGDIGVVRVPGVTAAPVLNWGDSANYSIGETVYLVGDPLGRDFQSISKGVVRDNQYVEPSGGALLENILVDCPAFGGNSGSPVLANDGRVVGIYTFGFIGTESLGGGPAQSLAEPVVNAMISNLANYTAKRYLGISWSAVDSFRATLLFSNSNLANFKLGGVRVNQKLSDSPLTGIQVGDIITEINGVRVGSYPGQTSINRVTWLITSSQSVSIKFVRPPATTESTVVLTLSEDFSSRPSQDGPLLGNNVGEIPGIPGNPILRLIRGNQARESPNSS